MATTKEMQDRARAARRASIKILSGSSPERLKALGLRNVDPEDIKSALAGVPDNHPQLVDLGDSFAIYGEVAELAQKFYVENDPKKAIELIKKAYDVAIASGTPVKIAEEWGKYNLQRRFK